MPPELTAIPLVDPSALPDEPAAVSVPPLTNVDPENVFVPVRVSVPAPDFTNAMLPWAPPFVPAITPAKVVEMPVPGLIVKVLVVPTVVFLTVAVLSPAREATPSLRLAMSRTLDVLIVMSVCGDVGKTLLAPNCIVPVFWIVVGPL